MKADMGCKNKAVCLAQTRFLHHFFHSYFHLQSKEVDFLQHLRIEL